MYLHRFQPTTRTTYFYVVCSNALIPVSKQFFKGNLLIMKHPHKFTYFRLQGIVTDELAQVPFKCVLHCDQLWNLEDISH